MFECETERLVLKVLDKKDAKLVLDYYIRNRDFLREWEPERNEEFFTLTFMERVLECELKEYEQGRLLRLWIFKKGDMSRVIGTVAFNNIIKGMAYKYLKINGKWEDHIHMVLLNPDL